MVPEFTFKYQYKKNFDGKIHSEYETKRDIVVARWVVMLAMFAMICMKIDSKLGIEKEERLSPFVTLFWAGVFALGEYFISRRFPYPTKYIIEPMNQQEIADELKNWRRELKAAASEYEKKHRGTVRGMRVGKIKVGNFPTSTYKFQVCTTQVLNQTRVVKQEPIRRIAVKYYTMNSEDDPKVIYFVYFPYLKKLQNATVHFC